jgi:hypothetical protein
MISKRRFPAPLVVVALVLAAAASGCEIIANFDRSLIPDEAGADAPYEATYPDGAALDTSIPITEDGAAADTSIPTDGGADSSLSDSSSNDGTVGDSTTADVIVADVITADSNVADSNAADTNVPDTSPPLDASDDGG